MKTTVLLSLFFVLVAMGNAQTTEETVPRSYKHQMGMNVTFFVKQFFTPNDTFIKQGNAPAFTYKFIPNGRGLRTGLTLMVSNTNTNPNTGQSITSTRSTAMGIRAGYEIRKQLDKRWLCYYGGDVFYNYTFNTRKTVFTASGFPPKQNESVDDNLAASLGAGPVLGFEFKLGNRVSFNAEANAYMAYTEERRWVRNTLFAGGNTNSYSSKFGFDIVIPTTLFFVFNF